MPKISCSHEAYVFDTMYYSYGRIKQLEPMEGKTKVHSDKTSGEDDDKENELEVIDGVGAETQGSVEKLQLVAETFNWIR
ncbi:hypothetical protein MKW92_033346 [Papaver armeniacum]|nr:hypothetical protein MKW92_033346 [Papaver armeniacum]